MVLGEYPAQAANQLIRREWVNNARARWDAYLSQYGEVPPVGTRAVMGLEELLTPTYEIANGKVRVMRKEIMRELLKRSPDRADALCLTFAPSGFFGGLDLS